MFHHTTMVAYHNYMYAAYKFYTNYLPLTVYAPLQAHKYSDRPGCYYLYTMMTYMYRIGLALFFFYYAIMRILLKSRILKSQPAEHALCTRGLARQLAS